MKGTAGQMKKNVGRLGRARVDGRVGADEMGWGG